MKPPLADRLLPLLQLKFFWKRLSLPGELLSTFIMIMEPTLLIKYFNKSALFGWFYNTFPELGWFYNTFPELITLNSLF